MQGESTKAMHSSLYSRIKELKCYSLRLTPPSKMAALNALIEPLWIRQKQCGMKLACLINGGSSPPLPSPTARRQPRPRRPGTPTCSCRDARMRRVIPHLPECRILDVPDVVSSNDVTEIVKLRGRDPMTGHYLPRARRDAGRLGRLAASQAGGGRLTQAGRPAITPRTAHGQRHGHRIGW